MDSGKQSGFTLVELSIVLVIIGLLVGGILVGRDLIDAAAVRAQISQIERYNTAVNTFRLKFDYLPGDIPDPFATQCGFVSRGQYAGEGDGNGIIEGIKCAVAGCTDDYGVVSGESAMFWVDLSTAKLLDGGFSVATPTYIPGWPMTVTQINQLLPQAKVGRSNYIYVWTGGWQLNSLVPDHNNYYSISAIETSGHLGETIPISALTVSQAYNIDVKMDDGLPQSGRVMAFVPSDDGIWWTVNGAENGGGHGDYDSASGTYGPVTSPIDIHTLGIYILL